MLELGLQMEGGRESAIDFESRGMKEFGSSTLQFAFCSHARIMQAHLA